jgi:hypothetical protein
MSIRHFLRAIRDSASGRTTYVLGLARTAAIRMLLEDAKGVSGD